MKRVCKIAMEFAANEDIYNSMLESLRSGNEWENKIEKKEENKKTKFINGKFQTGESNYCSNNFYLFVPFLLCSLKSQLQN